MVKVNLITLEMVEEYNKNQRLKMEQLGYYPGIHIEIPYETNSKGKLGGMKNE